MGTSSPNCAFAAAALARMVASSSQCVAMSIGHSLKMPSSTAASSTSMSPVELPMKTLTPQTRVGLQDFVEVAVGGAHEEAVVRRADLGRPVVFVLQQLLGQGLWDGVGHLHEGGDASGHGGAGFGGDLCFVGEAGFAEMNLVVDHARQEVEPGAIVQGGPLRFVRHFGIGMSIEVRPDGCDAVSSMSKSADSTRPSLRGWHR